MTDWVREILERYGQRAVLEMAEGERDVGTVTEMGWVDGRLWLYLGREEIRPGDTVRWNGMAFQARSSRPYMIGGTLSHWWASLERRREAAECGS